ncbi:hypothetical protein CDL12_16129 [Handroanthus impetiginosus]|uniref:Uncharacterized protein n=1 Tax=Handroanthus impetiginosus TaxID=429701 RepID=A0A2G9H179_9LAMI|nr:hypothetical protein CDL12_16129 [Handroanthus impetiginosus]
MKAKIVYNLFFIGFLLMYDLNPSTQNPLSKYDRQLRVADPPPPPPCWSTRIHQPCLSRSFHERILSFPPPPTSFLAVPTADAISFWDHELLMHPLLFFMYPAKLDFFLFFQ